MPTIVSMESRSCIRSVPTVGRRDKFPHIFSEPVFGWVNKELFLTRSKPHSSPFGGEINSNFKEFRSPKTGVRF